MKNKWVLGLSLLLMAHTVNAQGIDRVFPGQNRISFGQLIRNTFNLSDYNKSYAVVVGISGYNNFPDLPSTKNDAIRMKDFLINEAGFDYVHLLTEERVTLRRLRNIMVDIMPGKVKSNDRFLFYWSGHGVTRKLRHKEWGYLPLHLSGSEEYGNMVRMADLSDWDELLSAKQTLYLLDACFSGLVGNEIKGYRNETIQQIARPSRQILTAGLADEVAIAGRAFGGSLFTTAVIDGLKGEADTSSKRFKKDGIVSAKELELYVKKRVAEERGRPRGGRKLSPMTPTLLSLRGGPGDFFFVDKRFVEREDNTVAHNTGVVGGSTPVSNKGGVQVINKDPVWFEPDMVDIPAGSFLMGCDPARDGECGFNEKPLHRVSIGAFQMAKTEVTFEQWDVCTAAGVCIYAKDHQGWGRGKHPVINVSWHDAQVYVRWLNQQTGKRYQLPNEAQWEYAARANRQAAYPWGNTIDCSQANYGRYSGQCGGKERTEPVGSYAPNAFGLYDTVGNVWEWVQDCYHSSYQSAPVNGVTRTTCDSDKGLRVLRGGSWSDSSFSVRSASRDYYDDGDFNVGFRVVCSPIGC